MYNPAPQLATVWIHELISISDTTDVIRDRPTVPDTKHLPASSVNNLLVPR